MLKIMEFFFMETSAKTDHNVTALFEAIALKLPKSAPPPRSQGVVIDPDLMPDDKNTKPGCCGGGGSAQ